MADQFSKMYDFERVGGDQRTRLAEMLRANALNQPQGQMVSGWYVKPSITQQLNPALSGALGVYMGAQLDEERKAKTAELLRQLSQGKEVEPIPAVQNFNGMEQSAQQTPISQQAPQNELERITQRRTSTEMSQAAPAMMPQQQQRYVPLTEEEKIGKVMELAQYNPYAAQIWSTQDAARQARLSKAEERAMDREFKREMQQEQLQGRMDLARMTAGIAAANRPERMLTVLDTNTGMPLTIPQSQMQPGMTIYNPTTAKAFAEQKEKGLGKKGVSDTLDVLETQYKALNAGMGMPSTENRWGSNLGAKVAGTGVGQWAGQVLGTENQKARDIIAQTRPLMLADIKKATGMTASEMNSDRELQMWLAAATDPTKGYEANMEAIKNLRNKYGLGTNQSSSSW